MGQRHTPGPWHAEWDGERWAIRAVASTVAEIYATEPYDKERDAPDARLIAKAPEMRAWIAGIARGSYAENRADIAGLTDDARALLATIDGTDGGQS
jgi:hypothetical protein